MDISKSTLAKRVARAVSFGAVAALTICLCLSFGCAMQSNAQKSAGEISVLPACAEDYESALAAVREKADDAKLLAVRSSTYSSALAPASWMYLFYSWERASAYTVFMTNGQASVADMSGMAYNQTAFDAVPDPAEMVYDADEAYALLVESLEGDESLLTCRAYLMTYVAEDEDPTADAFKWFFSLNEEDDISDVASALKDSDELENVSEHREFSVNALTGEVLELQIASDDEA